MARRVLLGFCLILYLLLLPLLFSACNAAETEEAAAGFCFVFMSDTQAEPESGDYSVWAGLLQSAAAQQPALLLLGGDLVNDGDDAAEWQRFFDAAGDTLTGLPVLAAAGNHDQRGLLRELLPAPDCANGHDTHFFSSDYENVHFVILVSNRMGAANAADIDWLAADLAANTQPWVVVVCHHPPLPPLAIPKDEQRAATIQAAFLPLFTEYGVDLVLSGHQHIYTRSSGTAPAYVTVCSGGKYYQAETTGDYACVLPESALYLLARVKTDALELAAVNAAGDIVDQAVITKEEAK